MFLNVRNPDRASEAHLKSFNQTLNSQSIPYLLKKLPVSLSSVFFFSIFRGWSGSRVSCLAVAQHPGCLPALLWRFAVPWSRQGAHLVLHFAPCLEQHSTFEESDVVASLQFTVYSVQKNADKCRQAEIRLKKFPRSHTAKKRCQRLTTTRLPAPCGKSSMFR